MLAELATRPLVPDGFAPMKRDAFVEKAEDWAITAAFASALTSCEDKDTLLKRARDIRVDDLDIILRESITDAVEELTGVIEVMIGAVERLNIAQAVEECA